MQLPKHLLFPAAKHETLVTMFAALKMSLYPVESPPMQASSSMFSLYRHRDEPTRQYRTHPCTLSQRELKQNLGLATPNDKLMFGQSWRQERVDCRMRSEFARCPRLEHDQPECCNLFLFFIIFPCAITIANPSSTGMRIPGGYVRNAHGCYNNLSHIHNTTRLQLP